MLHFYQRSWLKLVEAIASLIDQDSEFVFDALDGKTELTETNGTPAKPAVIPYRNEPVAFFFVLFGLTFEALVGRPNDSNGARSQALEILTALKKILKPSVSGNAIYQEVVFSETMDMFDRLVLTESLSVQSVIVEIARNLCLEHPSARRGSTSREEETLSDDIDQLFELTRIIILVIAGLVPNLTEDKTRGTSKCILDRLQTNSLIVRYELNDEAVALLSLALSALVDASAVFPSVIETDLHACIIHIFATILATPSCQATVVPQSLSIFKRFLTRITSKTSPRSETSSQLRTALGQFLNILFKAQLRETEAAIPCEKNTLLTITILITTAGNVFDAADPLLEKFAKELNNCLNSRIPNKVAASCAQSLLLAPKKSPAESAFSILLLPYLLSFIAEEPAQEGFEEARSIVTRTLSAFPTSAAVPSDKVSIALALVIPTLLARAANEGVSSYKEIAQRLLESAAAAGQEAFGPVVAELQPELKMLMEEVVRQGGGLKEEKRDVSDEPAIALKMDFLGS
jgi:HEAT repeat-containing protein 5